MRESAGESGRRAAGPGSWARKLALRARRDGSSALVSAGGLRSPGPASPIPALRPPLHSAQPTAVLPNAPPPGPPPGPPKAKDRRSQLSPGTGPGGDGREDGDYQVPWDQEPRGPAVAQLEACLRRSLCLSAPSPQHSASSVLPHAPTTYERIWDQPTSAAPLPLDTCERAGDEGPWEKSSASPSSASSGGAGSGRKSSASQSSVDSAPAGLVRPLPLADFAGSLQAAASQASSSATLAKTPPTPLVETAFLSGPVPAGDLRRCREETEQRERLIQRLCSELCDETGPEPAPRRRGLPFPVSPQRPSSPPRPSPPQASPTPPSPNLVSNYDNVADAIEAQRSSALSQRLASPEPRLSDPPTRADEGTAQGGAVDYDVPWEFCNEAKVNRLLAKRGAETGGKAAVEVGGGAGGKVGGGLKSRSGLRLRLGQEGDGPAEEGEVAGEAEPRGSGGRLEEAEWYHGCVTREEAERRLAAAPDGSFLVRLCGAQRRGAQAADSDYALSLKSPRGFMHMKIQRRGLNGAGQAEWVLGYFSSPFPSVPAMLAYYARHKLPVKGAEHIALRFPLKDRLL